MDNMMAAQAVCTTVELMSRPVKTERGKISTKVDGGGATFLAGKMKDWVTKGVSPT